MSPKRRYATGRDEAPLARAFIAGYAERDCAGIAGNVRRDCATNSGLDATKMLDRPQVIIPFMHHDRVVGWCARFLDNRQPRYINHSQPGYVFGTDLQRPAWQHVIVTEGIFDALSIGGLALMHNTVSDARAKLIRRLGKEVTVVPDQDSAGVELIDRAVELNWAVSIPNWSADVKDVNDAVKKYGRLGTLITIMQARETSRIKIELRKKQLVKRLRN